MKQLVISLILLIPTAAGTAEYHRYSNLERVAEVRNGKVTIQAQPTIVRRLGQFAYAHGCKPEHIVQFAEALATTSDPKTLAAIAAVESGFDPEAKGKSGEFGAFQVISEEWGPVPEDIGGQAEQSDRIFSSLRNGNGTLATAVRKYNGNPRNPATARYARRVMDLRGEI